MNKMNISFASDNNLYCSIELKNCFTHQTFANFNEAFNYALQNNCLVSLDFSQITTSKNVEFNKVKSLLSIHSVVGGKLYFSI